MTEFDPHSHGVHVASGRGPAGSNRVGAVPTSRLGVVVVQLVSLVKGAGPAERARCECAEPCGSVCTDRPAEGLEDAGLPEDTSDAGMSTVEYAVGTVVAAAFAAVLYQIVTGDSVVSGLTDLINRALSTSF